MEKQDLTSLLVAILKDEIEGTVEVENGEIIIKYPDGAMNTISVK